MQTDLRRALYAGVVFWSALLLLLVQPVITKAILPWFGGSAGVWTTSMLFFQLALLLGYLYAHLLHRMFGLRTQIVIHCVLLIVASLTLPIEPSPAWKPAGHSEPLVRILGLLFSTVGLPYFLLATTSPLLQSWYAAVFRSDLPWRLYAVSNIGSLVALLAYPVLIEPALTVQQQLRWWSWGFGLFALLCAVGGAVSVRDGAPVRSFGHPALSRLALWLGLSAVPSVLWLAVANQLTQDVAAIPFLWIVPLAIYLLSFVLTFNSNFWYRPRIFRWILPPAWAGVVAVVAQQGYLHIGLTFLALVTALFLCCMFCHGELSRLKPPTDELTAFYLTIAAGGALGGVFVGVVAPRIFDQYLELPVGLLACIVLALWLLYKLTDKRVLRIGGVAALGVVAALVTRGQGVGYQVNLRNFYGTLQVSEGEDDNDFKYRSLYNGAIQHGLQYLAADRSRIPTTYYGPASGAALVIDLLGKSGPLRVGVIGLGVGTMATWARPGDYYRFYEINPDVIRIARSEFRYLKESRAPADVIEGDARLSLEREQPENFDVLVIDAFSGDSIPIHLLTREAFSLYFRHLAPGGAIAVHITNKHLDLAPVVKRLADDQKAHALLFFNSKEDARKIYYSSWVIVTKSDEIDSKLGWMASPLRPRRQLRLWTDDYSNLFSIVK